MIKKINGNAYGVVEYAVSFENEVEQLPTTVGQGSVCIVLENTNVYMFDESDATWKLFVGGSTTGGGSAVASDKLVEIPIIDSTLNLTTDKYQLAHMENNAEIVLPTVDKYTEIHLFFNTTEELTLTLPSVKWQTEPTLEANKTYEFIFTYANEWLGGMVVYSA